MPESTLRTLIEAREIERRVRELGEAIGAEYPDGTIYLIGVLKGACVFLSDLLRAIPRPARFDFVAASSYGAATTSSGRVTLTRDVGVDLRGAHVLLVEDIIDTGITVEFLMEHLRAKEPLSLRVVTLLDKPARRRRPVPIDFVGFTVPDEFVVGYGMDYDEDYRDLPDVRVWGGPDGSPPSD
jgi:hypoxanthine phosphoribosyltransferase